MKYYHCDKCSKRHQVYYSMIHPGPMMMFDMTEQEIKQRIYKQGEGMMIIDQERVFIRGEIIMNIHFDETLFLTLLLWAELDFEEVQSKMDRAKNLKIPVELEGRLDSGGPFYPNCKHIKAKLLPHNSIHGDPQMVPQGYNDDLSLDYTTGITKRRLINLMNKLHHNQI